MTRSFLTRMLGAAAALMMALSVFAGCRVYTGWRTVRLSGDVQETTVYGSGASDGWTVEIEKLSFSDSENAVIRLVPSDSVRIEAKYSGDFADYGFEITAKNGKIRIGTNHNYNYIADVFEITVYADFDHVELSGGCSLEIDASGAEELRLDISGACDCLVENAAAKRLEIELRVPQISIFPARRRPLWWTFPVRRMWRRNRLSRRTRTFGCPARARLSCPSRIR